MHTPRSLGVALAVAAALLLPGAASAQIVFEERFDGAGVPAGFPPVGGRAHRIATAPGIASDRLRLELLGLVLDENWSDLRRELARNARRLDARLAAQLDGDAAALGGHAPRH